MSSPYITRLLRYHFLEGLDSFLAKMAMSWVGGWLRSPVLGHRLFNIQSVYLVPAVLGAIASVDHRVLYWKASSELLGTGRSRGGDPTQAGGMNRWTVLQMEVNKCNVNHSVAIFAVSEGFHRYTRLMRKGSSGTPVWNAPDWLTPRAGIALYRAA